MSIDAPILNKNCDNFTAPAVIYTCPLGVETTPAAKTTPPAIQNPKPKTLPLTLLPFGSVYVIGLFEQ